MKQLLVVLFLVFVFALPASAQTFRGAINGTVTDPSGASVPGATVKATDTATNIEHSTVTTGDGPAGRNLQGNCHFGGLPCV